MNALIEHFDTKTWLSNNFIPHRLSGKNISKDWIGVCCPFCPESDPDYGYHLGINKKNNSINCWRCNTTGTVVKLIQKLKRISYNETLKVLENYQLLLFNTPQQKSSTDQLNIVIPKIAKRKFYPIHLDYLKKRGFDPDELIHRYKLLASFNIGESKYRYRIFIPVFYNGQIVNYTARDVTDTKETRYLNCPNETAIIPIKQCLYNIDNVGNRKSIIIVEGPFDVWRIGSGCIATFGSQFTIQQTNEIKKHKFDRITIIFDREDSAQEQAIQLRKSLVDQCNNVKIHKLHVKDPASLNSDKAENLKDLYL